MKSLCSQRRRPQRPFGWTQRSIWMSTNLKNSSEKSAWGRSKMIPQQDFVFCLLQLFARLLFHTFSQHQCPHGWEGTSTYKRNIFECDSLLLAYEILYDCRMISISKSRPDNFSSLYLDFIYMDILVIEKAKVLSLCNWSCAPPLILPTI